MRRRPRLSRLPVSLILGLLTVVLPGCHRKHTGPKPKVVTSIFPVYDLTRRVAGEDADVIMLEPPGESEHQFQPSPSDMEKATGTALAVMIGLDLDAWMQPMMTRMAPKARVLRLADRVPTLPRELNLQNEGQQAKRDAIRAGLPDDDPRAASTIDAHVWLDPQRAILMTRAIADELCRVDAADAHSYRERALAVTNSLQELDREIETRSGGWKQKVFVTLHDDFRYYASRYHLTVAVAVEPYAGIRPSIRYDQLVLARLRERGAGGIFGEPQLDSQPAKTLSQASNVPYGVLDPLGGTPGVDSYEALLRFDTDALEKLLAGPAAPGKPASSPSAASPRPDETAPSGSPNEQAP